MGFTGPQREQLPTQLNRLYKEKENPLKNTKQISDK